MRGRCVPAMIVSGLMLVGSMSAALADAIDGNWCHPDGRRLTIRGRDIVTPGGMRMQGDYTRHSFAYVVPSGEPGPGETVSMVLLSEYLMHARQGGSAAPVQAWNRCPPDISALPEGRVPSASERSDGLPNVSMGLMRPTHLVAPPQLV